MHGAGAERVGRAAGHEARQIGERAIISGGGVQSGHSALRSTVFARPGGEALAADADPVADRLAAGQHVVEIGVLGVDDDGARRLVGRIFDGHAAQVGADLVAVIGRRVAGTEPAEWIGGCVGGADGRGNDRGDGRNAGELVHDVPLFPSTDWSRQGARRFKMGRKNCARVRAVSCWWPGSTPQSGLPWRQNPAFNGLF